MKRVIVPSVALALVCCAPSTFGGETIEYHLQPGQAWRCRRETVTLIPQGDNTLESRQTTTIDYAVKAGSESGTLILEARVSEHVNSMTMPGLPAIPSQSMALGGITFRATLGAKGLLGPAQVETTDPEALDNQRQQAEATARNLTSTVFWFPNLPAQLPAPGEEFESERKDRLGDSGPVSMATDMRVQQTYTLDEVRDGVAWCSVTERISTRQKHPMSDTDITTDTKSEGTAEFDLAKGMWTAMTTTSKTTTGGLPEGMAGGGATTRMTVRMEPVGP